MQTKILRVFSFSVFLVFGLLPTFWVSFINLAEIIDRTNGRNTIFSQMAILTKTEAILYCSGWTLLFNFLFYLSVRSLMKEKFVRSIIFSLIVFLTIIISLFVDTMLNNQSV